MICSVFLYKTWFDWCFHHEVSYNTYGELTPEDGEYDYTIMLSGHTDTSWNWKHSAIKSKLNPAFAFIKVGLGAVCVIVTTALAWTLAISQYVDYITWMFARVQARAVVTMTHTAPRPTLMKAKAGFSLLLIALCFQFQLVSVCPDSIMV